MSGETPPVRTPDPLASSRRRALDRLGESLSFMGLGSIGDIGSATFGTVQSLTWETATDWNNAADEYGVAHENTANTDYNDASVIQKGYSTENPISSANLVAYWPLHDLSGDSTIDDLSGNGNDGTNNSAQNLSSGLLGTSAADFGASSDSWYITQPVNIFDGSQDFTTVLWAEGSTDSNYNYFAYYDGSDDLYQFGNNQMRLGHVGGNEHDLGWTEDTGLRLWVHTFDSSTPESVVYKDLSQMASASNGIDTPNINPPDIGRRGGSTNASDADMYGVWIFDTVLSSSAQQELYDTVRGESYLETATKSVSTSTKPDLSNLSYSLNSQTIQVDVIGSPGTASEEVNTVTLDGATSYSISWSSGHTDFRIKPRLSTSDDNTTPTFSAATLS